MRATGLAFELFLIEGGFPVGRAHAALGEGEACVHLHNVLEPYEPLGRETGGIDQAGEVGEFEEAGRRDAVVTEEFATVVYQTSRSAYVIRIGKRHA